MATRYLAEGNSSKKIGETTTTKKIAEPATTKRINVSKGRNNPTNSKKAGASTYKQDKDKEDEERRIFQNRVPNLLRSNDTAEARENENKEKELNKKEPPVEENKSIQISAYTQFNTTNIDKQKDQEPSSNLNESDSENKRNEQEMKEKKRELNEKELDAKVYITLSETPTAFMFFMPSTKYFKERNDVEVLQEKKKEEFFKLYKEKRKNEESFTQRGVQTLNKFRRNQVVSTSSMKDQESQDPVHETISALSWNIIDSINENKNKKEDESKLFQNHLDKKIKSQLKEKIKNVDLVNPDESYSMHRSQISDNNSSLTNTKQFVSLQSSTRPRPRASNITGNNTSNFIRENDPDQSSANTSQIKNANEIQKQPGKQSHKNVQELTMELPSSIINPLRYVERLLSQNQFHFKQIAYKNYPISLETFQDNSTRRNDLDFIEENENVDENLKMQKEKEKKEIELVTNNNNPDPDMRFLFRFSGQKILQENKSKYLVQSLDWNPYNKDLLAAGYGDPDIDSKNGGLLCFWTLKNPLHPERVIHTPRGITSCNFSNKNPYYLVASDYAGEIMIYDLRVNNNKPIADSTEEKDKHTDIVWEAKWIERPNDKNEMIVSISSDGKLKEWSLKKGLEVTDLMRMKKNISYPDKRLSPFAKYEKNKDQNKDSLVFRDANGLSFDFPKNDTTIYYVSLEECTLHRCRISYKDQYTDTYYGHQGPAYKVRCNPFDPNILLSCSYDWTVKIWNTKQIYPLINCRSPKLFHQVNDIEWSPFTSTIFGLVADDGRIEIWDLARGGVEPTIRWFPTETNKIGVPRKSLKFSRSSQVMASGDADFDIDIFRLYNLKHVEVSDEDQKRRLQTIILQNSELGTKLN